MKIAVFGADGRMGGETCRAISLDPELELIAGIDIADSRDKASGGDVVVDFTHPDSVMDNITWCVEQGISIVVGTSGFTPERLEQVRQQLGEDPSVGVLIAPNFSIGAVLMMHFSQVAAPYFESVEIIETHHTGKADAPSGTAASTAQRIAQARHQADCAPMVDSTTHEFSGARGASVDGIRVHSLRLPGVIAAQEVRFTSAGETLSVVNDARARSSYMPGVLQGIRWVSEHRGLTVGLEPVLGLAGVLNE
ncbi:MAG: 4-hydroxy-tetrahydrodipicolinate reductase [Propionibacteriaceae bacterium]|nr:4-hydroxy-tetrahydrodipicolinate reductase [Propionibacteriaceae bacterium]